MYMHACAPDSLVDNVLYVDSKWIFDSSTDEHKYRHNTEPYCIQ